MNKKIIVNELSSWPDVILGIVLGIIIMVLSLIVVIKISDLFPDMPIGFSLLIFFGGLIGPCWIFIYVWFKIRIRRKKIAVTPILDVDEKVPISEEQKEILDGVEGAGKLQDIVTGSGGLLTDIARTAILSAARKGSHIKYTLCEEGIVLYQGSNGYLHHWRRIGELTADLKNKQFEFTPIGRKVKLILSAPNNFEETKQVLSKYIEVH